MDPVRHRFRVVHPVLDIHQGLFVPRVPIHLLVLEDPFVHVYRRVPVVPVRRFFRIYHFRRVFPDFQDSLGDRLPRYVPGVRVVLERNLIFIKNFTVRSGIAWLANRSRRTPRSMWTTSTAGILKLRYYDNF